MPTWLGLVVPLVLSLMICTVLAGRRLSLARTSASVLLSQALFHVLFVLGAGNVMMTASSGHDHGAMMHSAVISADATAALYGDTTMWVGHALAAVVTIVALRRGERSLVALRDTARSLVRWVCRRIALVTVAVVPHPLLPSAAVASAVSVPPLRVVLRRAPRRGPPAFVLA